MKTVIPDESILDELSQNLRRTGTEAFLSGPIVLPTRRFFPEPYERGPDGVRTLTRRLLTHVGLPQTRVLVDDFRNGPIGSGFSPPEIAIDAIGKDRVRLQLYADGLEDFLVYGLTHIVATVQLQQLSAVATAYRDAAPESTDADERQASLVAFAKGLGVLVVNGTDLYRAREDLRGAVVARFAQWNVGGLDRETAAFVLAAQVVVRDANEAPAIIDVLEPSQVRLFRDYVTRLEPHRSELIERLALPKHWPAAVSATELAPLSDLDDDDELEQRHLPAWRRNEGTTVQRVPLTPPRETIRSGAKLGAILGMLCLGTALGTRESIFVLAALPVFGIVTLFGVAVAKWGSTCLCSDPDCESPLDRSDSICSGCGGTVASS